MRGVHIIPKSGNLVSRYLCTYILLIEFYSTVSNSSKMTSRATALRLVSQPSAS